MEPVAMNAPPADPFEPWLGADDLELLQSFQAPPEPQHASQFHVVYAAGAPSSGFEPVLKRGTYDAMPHYSSDGSTGSDSADANTGGALSPPVQSLVRTRTVSTKKNFPSAKPAPLRKATSAVSAPSTALLSPPMSPPSITVGEQGLMSAEELRREKNRQKVRRHYYRKLNHLNALRSEVEQLETKFKRLLKQNASSSALVANGTSMRHDHEALLNELIVSKSALEQENDQLRRLFSMQQSQFAWICELFTTDHDLFHSSEMAKTAFIKPFTKRECFAVRDKALDDVLAVCQALPVRSRPASFGGWHDDVTVEGGLWRYALRKTFRNVSASTICDLTWPILRDPNGFSKMFSSPIEARSMVVQEVDENNAVMFQEYRAMDANDEYILMKSLFLVTRVQTATGEVCITRGLGIDRLLDPEQFLPSTGELASKVVWHDVFSWIKYDRTGLYGADCAVLFAGQSPTVGDNARFWSVEVVNLVVRWETALFGPPRLLVASDDSADDGAKGTTNASAEAV